MANPPSVNRGGLNLLSFFQELCINGTDDTARHVLTLFAIALACKGKTYIELGVMGGRTTLPILAAAYLNGGKLTSVDIVPTAFKISDPLSSHWQFIQGDAVAFLERWDGPMDFVFVDDWHSYEHVSKELELIGQHMGLSGVILLHDLMYGGHHPRYRSDLNAPESTEWGTGGPYRAVAELDRDVWEWATLPWGHGLTLLRKKG